ncbi:MAG: hypothetical protein DRO05_00100 [Thermoproteota archaeon]|nr:MAG: hypothetical protein DRO05_00100 [Candidatus Korarchaeota archaeon]
MKIGVPASLDSDLIEEALKFKGMGTDFIELNLTQPIPEEDELLDRTAVVERIIPLPVIHLPEVSARHEMKVLKDVVEAISNSSSYRKIFVTHLFGGREISLWQKKRALNEVLRIAEEYDVPIALENKSESRIFFRKMFQAFPDLNMCFDIGHAHLYFPESEILQFIKEFSDRIIHLHVHDNFGGGSDEWDLHLPLGMGSTDFKPLLEEAIKCPRLKTITMEVICFDDDYMFLSLNKLRRMIKREFGQKDRATD